jgi:hypothetical protein
VLGLFFAPLAKFLQLDFARNLLFIFAAPIISALASYAV